MSGPRELLLTYECNSNNSLSDGEAKISVGHPRRGCGARTGRVALDPIAHRPASFSGGCDWRWPARPLCACAPIPLRPSSGSECLIDRQFGFHRSLRNISAGPRDLWSDDSSVSRIAALVRLAPGLSGLVRA